MFVIRSLCLLLLSAAAFPVAAQADRARFRPFETGNVWVYDTFRDTLDPFQGGTPLGRLRFEARGDTAVGGTVYRRVDLVVVGPLGVPNACSVGVSVAADASVSLVGLSGTIPVESCGRILALPLATGLPAEARTVRASVGGAETTFADVRAVRQTGLTSGGYSFYRRSLFAPGVGLLASVQVDDIGADGYRQAIRLVYARLGNETVGALPDEVKQ